MSLWNASPKSRRLMQIGQICLVLGLLPRIFPNFTYGLHRDPLDFLCGFLLSISIVTMLTAILVARRTGGSC